MASPLSRQGPALRVVLATNDDVPGWIELAAEVGPLFGADMAGDPGFADGLRRNIDRGTAFCVRMDGRVAGAMTFNEDRIKWLAVAHSFRGQGVGRALVHHAMSRADREVAVTTFGIGHSHPDAGAARLFYARLGFMLTTDDPGPALDGTPREVWRWEK